MTSDITTPGSGGSVGPINTSLDVRNMIRHYAAPYKAIQPPWRQTLDDRCFALRDKDGAITKIYRWSGTVDEAIAIEESVWLPDVWAAQEVVDEAMKAPPEEIIRNVIVVMMKTLKTKPVEGLDTFINVLVHELMEPETGEPVCVAAIVAAVRETWLSQTFAPSACEFITIARKQQKRIESIQTELAWLEETCILARHLTKPEGSNIGEQETDVLF